MIGWRRASGLARSRLLVWSEEVAEVCFLSIRDPLGLRLAAFVVRRRVIMLAVQAAMNIRAALRAFVGPRDVALGLYLIVTCMTNHDRSR